MTLTIEGVPKRITCSQLTQWLAAVGIDSHRVLRSGGVYIGALAIRCELIALDEDGNPYAGPSGDIATHQVCIPIVDDDGDNA